MAHEPEILMLEAGEISTLKLRPFREGMLGKTLEDALQFLIEEHPDVLPGRMMAPTSDDPPRFVLLKREMQVMRGSLDHLLVDQHGVLTLVEAKLIENPDSHRAVIGQILDYASNAHVSWGEGRIREEAAAYWQWRGDDLRRVMATLLGPDTDLTEFWAKVDANLEARRLRLIIVADQLSPEVTRIIEFLNEEMTNVEVFGLELRCYAGDGHRLVMVPTLVGQSQAAAVKKQRTTGRRSWSPEMLREHFGKDADDGVGRSILRILDWALERDAFASLGTTSPSVSVLGRVGRARVMAAYDFNEGCVWVWTNGDHYVGGIKERDRLVGELKTHGFLPDAFDPDEDPNDGVYLTLKLCEISPERLEELLDSLAPHCRTQ